MKYLIKLQKLLKAVTMAVLLSLLAAGLLPAGTVSAEESASFSWYNPETGYDILIEDDAALLTTEEKNLLADTMERVSYYGNVVFKSIVNLLLRPFLFPRNIWQRRGEWYPVSDRYG